MASGLSNAIIKSKLTSGRYYDKSGTGLHLLVDKRGSKYWVQRYTLNGKRRELGLGSFPNVSLLQAREQALISKRISKEGKDPKGQIKKQKEIPSFREAVDKYLEFKLTEFSNEKHKRQWQSSIKTYAFPVIGNTPVNEITVDHIVQALSAIWADKTETASRLRGRIEHVLSWATVGGYRSGFNPAIWQGNLSELLPSPSSIQEKKHHPALQLVDVQRWCQDLNSRDGVGADALKFMMFCLNRSVEVRGLEWQELHLFNATEADEKGFKSIWTIPGKRMKTKREHRVPITSKMLDLINKQSHSEHNNLVFRGLKGGKLSDMTLSALMKRMNETALIETGIGFIDPKQGNRPAVPHGLRSTFRGWVAENQHSREAAELQLSHHVGSKVEHAYYRTDLIVERARILDAWGNFLERSL